MGALPPTLRNFPVPHLLQLGRRISTPGFGSDINIQTTAACPLGFQAAVDTALCEGGELATSPLLASVSPSGKLSHENSHHCPHGIPPMSFN